MPPSMLQADAETLKARNATLGRRLMRKRTALPARSFPAARNKTSSRARLRAMTPSSSSKVAIVRTTPENALEDYQRLFELGGGRRALQPGATTILKDNISWHFPMPAANTTPWQLEGTILALRQAGYFSLSCVQNKTVVTD